MIVTVLGARPQFIKAAALSRAFVDAGIKQRIIHTGQHYDAKMSDVFFSELDIPGVDKNLNIGSGNHGNQTGKMMIAIEDYLLRQDEKIECLLVYGDTNSTLAGALVASKLHIPIVHVEAGLRSFNNKMPEEVNRILTDHISTILFCSSDEGKNQLKREGIIENVHVVGDIMLDAVKLFLPLAKKPIFNVADFTFKEKYNLITIHRPANTDDIEVLQEILNGIGNLPYTNIWPLHPRNKKTVEKLKKPKNLIICEPFSYFEMLFVLQNCEKVLTDSGGLQKEAYWLKKPCITIRPQTEWLETLHNNWNQLCKPDSNEITLKYQKQPFEESWIELYGKGNSSKKIIEVIKYIL
jgi:UDP-GlcNAc3NAcA epimerase